MKQTYLILGPAITGYDLEKLDNTYSANDHELIVVSDGKSKVDFHVPESQTPTNIIVIAHGKIMDNQYRIYINSITERSGIEDIGIENKLVNLEMFGCYSAGAIHYIDKLAVGSTLMTSCAINHKSYAHFDNELIQKTAGCARPSNPFVKFISYLLANPDDNNFAIRLPQANQFFRSSIADLQDYSLASLTQWRIGQIKDYALFLQNIERGVNQEIDDQIAQVDTYLSNAQVVQELLNRFPIERYQEILLFKLVQYMAPIETIASIFAQVSAKTKLGNDRTLLRIAAYAGHKDVVEFLLNNGVAIDENDTFHIAAEKGRKAVVELLLERGANLLRENNRGNFPIHEAVASGNIEIVELILDRIYNIEIRTIKEGFTALHIAIQKGHYQIVEFLIARGANIEALDNEGDTPLYWAVYKKRENIVKLLLTKGANIEAQSLDGYTALMLATIKGNLAMVKLLLANGARTSNDKHSIMDFEDISDTIIAEVREFEADPVEYVTNHNDNLEDQIRGLNNLARSNAIMQENIIAEAKAEEVEELSQNMEEIEIDPKEEIIMKLVDPSNLADATIMEEPHSPIVEATIMDLNIPINPNSPIAIEVRYCFIEYDQPELIEACRKAADPLLKAQEDIATIIGNYYLNSVKGYYELINKALKIGSSNYQSLLKFMGYLSNSIMHTLDENDVDRATALYDQLENLIAIASNSFAFVPLGRPHSNDDFGDFGHGGDSGGDENSSHNHTQDGEFFPVYIGSINISDALMGHYLS